MQSLYTTNSSEKSSRAGVQRFLAQLGIGLLFFTGASLSVRAEEQLLSKSDSGYAFIEAIQRHHCKVRPSHNCKFDADQCRSRIEKLWQDLFSHPPSNDEIKRSCARISTEFELPGIHKLLQDLYAEVRALAPSVGLDAVAGLRFGSLPIREINAQVLPPDPTLGQFVLFNIRFFQFAHELAKIASLHIPMKIEGDSLTIDGSQEALDRRIVDNPELQFLFVNRLVHFLDLEGLKPAPPPKNIQPILSRYHWGIELFAMAHEYSHIALRHIGPTSPIKSIDVDAASLGISGQKGDWIQELEADHYAAKILRTTADRKLATGDHNLVDFMIPLTAEFYFLTRHIVLDATALLFGDGKKTQPTSEESRLLDVALQCTAAPECNLATFLKQHPPIAEGHPHPSIRRAFVRRVLTKAPVDDNDAAMQTLAAQMLRNIEHLWSRLEDGLRSPGAATLIDSIRKARSERMSKQ